MIAKCSVKPYEWELMYHRDDRAFHSKNNSVHRSCVLYSSCSCSVCSVGIEAPPDFRLVGEYRKACNTYYLILSKVSMTSDMHMSVVIALMDDLFSEPLENDELNTASPGQTYPPPTRPCLVCRQTAWQWDSQQNQYICASGSAAHHEYREWHHQTFPWLTSATNL